MNTANTGSTEPACQTKQTKRNTDSGCLAVSDVLTKDDVSKDVGTKGFVTKDVVSQEVAQVTKAQVSGQGASKSISASFNILIPNPAKGSQASALLSASNFSKFKGMHRLLCPWLMCNSKAELSFSSASSF